MKWVTGMISHKLVRETTVELLRRAVTEVSPDIKEGLTQAYKKEVDSIPKLQLKTIIKNLKLAEEKKIPICQDTGVPIFYVAVGSVRIDRLEEAIIEGVKEATRVIPLRPNIVDPFTRLNSGTNLGTKIPFINYRLTDKKYVEIIAFPKGAGSENVSALSMLTPSQGINGIKEFVLDTILTAGGKPCPPTVIGVGIGGSADIAMRLAKEVLLRPINRRHRNSMIAELEKELYNLINATGIGPMGLGGKTTTLGVNIDYADCHIASLPVAINIQCWANRKALARIYSNGKVSYQKQWED